MTVGKMISLLCIYCSEVDELLMCHSVDEIEVHDDCILVYFRDANTSNIRIERKDHD